MKAKTKSVLAGVFTVLTWGALLLGWEVVMSVAALTAILLWSSAVGRPSAAHIEKANHILTSGRREAA